MVRGRGFQLVFASNYKGIVGPGPEGFEPSKVQVRFRQASLEFNLKCDGYVTKGSPMRAAGPYPCTIVLQCPCGRTYSV